MMMCKKEWRLSRSVRLPFDCHSGNLSDFEEAGGSGLAIRNCERPETISKINKVLVVLLVLGLCGCSQINKPSSIDSAANTFFAKQSQCERFVHAIAWSTVKHIAKMPNITDMRSWISSHREEKFAKIALDVQALTRHEVISPGDVADQLLITKALYRVLERQPGFGASGCDVDVQEIIEQEIYLSVGAWDSPIAEYLDQKG